MARTIPSDVTTILGNATHQVEQTCLITFPDASIFTWATSNLSSVAGRNWTNYLESIGDIRQTLEAPADQVNVAVQNKDRTPGLHLSQNWLQWRQATAILGRLYLYETRSSSGTWFEMFRGSVQQPNADDFQLTFTVVSDVVAAGPCVAARTENVQCPFKFKDSRTCGYSGILSTCNHHLASDGGCDGRANSHHYGGTEHRYAPDAAAPGTGNNGDLGNGDPIHDACPRLDQYVRVKGPDGRVMVKMVGFLSESDELWHPIRRRFRKIERLTIRKDQPMWELVGPQGMRGFSSASHPIIRSASDFLGTPVARLRRSDVFLMEGPEGLAIASCYRSRPAGVGDVLEILIDAQDPADKIYSYGDNSDGPMIVCHNNKEPILN